MFEFVRTQGQPVRMSAPAGVDVPDTLLVDGGRPLAGTVSVPGFKHSLVTACAAALVGRGVLALRNCPRIEEQRVLGELLVGLGGTVAVDGADLLLDLEGVEHSRIDPGLGGAIHGAVYLLPGLLSRFGSATMPVTGGCRLTGSGTGRPVEHYAAILRRFGATTEVGADGSLVARARGLRGQVVDLREFMTDPVTMTGPLYSGATKMAILCAAAARGRSVLRHPYPKPDVTDLVAVLTELGGHLWYRDPDELVIDGRGSESLCRTADHTLVSDLIEVVTWTAVSAVTASPLQLAGVTPSRIEQGLAAELTVLRRLGIGIERTDDHTLSVVPGATLARPVDVLVASRGVYSDSQPLLSLVSTLVAGQSTFRETVWEQRFGHVEGLVRLGCRARVTGTSLKVDGRCPARRAGQEVVAADLRAAACLVVAALGVPGRTTVHGCGHLARGYERFLERLRGIGAVIGPASLGTW